MAGVFKLERTETFFIEATDEENALDWLDEANPAYTHDNMVVVTPVLPKGWTAQGQDDGVYIKFVGRFMLRVIQPIRKDDYWTCQVWIRADDRLDEITEFADLRYEGWTRVLNEECQTAEFMVDATHYAEAMLWAMCMPVESLTKDVLGR